MTTTAWEARLPAVVRALYGTAGLALLGSLALTTFLPTRECRFAGCSLLTTGSYARIGPVPVALLGAAACFLLLFLGGVASRRTGSEWPAFVRFLRVVVALVAIALQLLVRASLGVSCAFCLTITALLGLAAIAGLSDLPDAGTSRAGRLAPLALASALLFFFYGPAGGTALSGAVARAVVEEPLAGRPTRNARYVAVLDPNCGVCQELFDRITNGSRAYARAEVAILFVSSGDDATADLLNHLLDALPEPQIAAFARAVHARGPIGYAHYRSLAKEVGLTWARDMRRKPRDGAALRASLRIASTPTILRRAEGAEEYRAFGRAEFDRVLTMSR